MIRTDKTLDIKGLISPRAELVTRNTLAGMKPGQVLTVITTCRAVKEEIAHLCEAVGSTLLLIEEEGGALHVQIKK